MGRRARATLAAAAVLATVAAVGGATTPTGATPPDAPSAGTLSGTVSNMGSDSVGVYVFAAGTNTLVTGTWVGPGGAWMIPGVPNGAYEIRFGARHPYWGAATRSDEMWSNTHDRDTATDVVVADAPVAGLDATLEATGTVTGSVTSGGVGVPGAVVSVIASSDTVSQQGTFRVLTNNTGAFTVPGVDVGTYTIAVDRDFDDVTDGTKAAFAVTAGGTANVGPIAVSIPAGVPGKATSLTAAMGIGTADITYGLPLSSGSSPLEAVLIGVSPTYTDVLFGEGFDARAIGLVNGVSNRFAVLWGNAQGWGPGRIVDGIPTGCQYLWFTDVPAASPFCGSIRWLVYEGIAGGYDDATFRPAASVSRQAMAAFLYRYAGSPDGPEPTCSAAQFSDVPASHQFCGEIAWLVDAGITTGFDDGSFRPTAPVSRQAMAAFLYRFQGSPFGSDPGCTAATFSDVPTSHPFCGEIDWLTDEGIANGYQDGTYRPSAPVSRQAMSAFLQRMDAGGPLAVADGSTALGAGSVPVPGASPGGWAEDAHVPEPTVLRVPLG